jgi:methionyl-tRNA formyltransferase
MGTPEFAVPSLERLASEHEVAAVFTQPDRPSGRGQKLSAPPVKQAAVALGLPVHQPLKIRTPEVFDLLQAIAADAIVVVGYGKIIPQSIIDLPRLGVINLHASLLPKYRGAAPINWAIVRGETRTGVTTMKIDAGLDTGDMLLREEIAITPDDDAITLGSRLATIGAPLLARTLEGLARGEITPVPQDHSQHTLAPILRKEDGLADWTMAAEELRNRVRGLQPWPGVFTPFRGGTLKVERVAAENITHKEQPGTLMIAGHQLFVACGSGRLELLEVRPEGKRRMPAADFLNGARVQSGELFGVR